MTFVLDERLKKDSHDIGSMKLCKLLLAADSRFPWFILVPQRAQITEIHQLSPDDTISLMIESNAVSRMIEAEFKADKINIAALGNVVPQLHVHHIARFKTDPAWPSPIWGVGAPEAYKPAELESLIQRVKTHLSRYLA
jgi:diadenosine tetraphosphate (Ap4A) HIT family hydrolase